MLEQAIAFTVGITLLATGISWLWHSKSWALWLEAIRIGSEQKALILGMIGFMVGAFIVAAHPVWTGAGLLVTIIGIAAMIEGAAYLLFPRLLPVLLSYCQPRYEVMIRFFGLIMAVLGGLVLWIWLVRLDDGL